MIICCRSVILLLSCLLPPFFGALVLVFRSRPTKGVCYGGLVGESVGGSTGSSVGSSVGFPVGNSVGGSTGNDVGRSVGSGGVAEQSNKYSGRKQGIVNE